MNSANLTAIFDKYRDNFARLNLFIYTSTNAEDILLFKFWLHLNETGDINRLVNPDSRRLSTFLSVFQQPAVVFYSLNKQGEIDSLMWFKDPSGDSIFCGLWLAQSLRSSRRAIYILQNIHSLVFEFYTTIIGTTWQPDILQISQKIGYNVVGSLTDFLGQPTVWLVQFLRENFQSSYLMCIGRK